MTQIPHDYHMHSEHSFDCHISIADRCRDAIDKGLAEIAITEHLDFVPGDESTGYYNPEAYFSDIVQAREQFGDQLVVRAGVEIGEIHRFPEQAQAIATGYPYDFILGSLHSLRADPSKIVMFPDFFVDKSERDAYEPYYEELLELVQFGGFDVIAHIDVPKRAGFTAYGDYRSGDFEEQIREVLKAAIERGIGIEINTGTARRPVGIPSPDTDVLRWYRELGGEIITVGSDAHSAGHVAWLFGPVPEMLREAGFDYVTGFAQRQPFRMPLTP